MSNKQIELTVRIISVTGDIETEDSKNWVYQNKYQYNLSPVIADKTKCFVQVLAILNTEYESGGSHEYLCEVCGLMENIKDKPDISSLFSIAMQAPKLLQKLFVDKKILRADRLTLWEPLDQQITLDLLNQELAVRYK